MEVNLDSIPLLERARLACNTIRSLYPEDFEVIATEEERDLAREDFKILTTHSDSKKAVRVNTLISTHTPPTIAHLDALLSEYDKELVNSAVRIREYVKNKLLEESSNPDGKIRIRALELLGKMKDVGLFTDRVEITHKTKTDEELTAELSSKLERFMGNAVLVDESEGNEPEEDEESEENEEGGFSQDDAPPHATNLPNVGSILGVNLT